MERELQKGYLDEYSVENPKIPTKQVKCFKLKRESPLVIEVLLPENKSGKAEPASPASP